MIDIDKLERMLMDIKKHNPLKDSTTYYPEEISIFDDAIVELERLQKFKEELDLILEYFNDEGNWNDYYYGCIGLADLVHKISYTH